MKINSNLLIKIGFLLSVFVGLIGDFFRPALYLQDVVNVLGLCLIVINKRKSKELRVVLFPMLLFLFVAFVGVIINGVSLHLLIWAIRNNYKYFVWFSFLVLFLKEKDVDWIIKILNGCFVLHLFMTIIQFIMGYRYDNLGGIFGIEAGSNTGVIILLLIVLFLNLHKYSSKEIPLTSLIFIICVALINSGLSELKVMFIIIPFFIVIYFMLDKNKLKGALVICCLVILMPIALNIFISIYPQYAGFLNLDVILNMSSTTSHYSGNDISRTSVFYYTPQIIQSWTGHHNSVYLGLGLGNGEYSSTYEFFNSDFYKQFGYTHYNWFSMSFLLVEVGYVGLFCYITFLGTAAYMSLKKYLKERSLQNELGLFMILTACFLVCYSAGMRTNYAYLVYTFMAFPFVQWDKNQ